MPGQQLTQMVRGKVVDADSKSNLLGVQVFLIGSDPLIGAITDNNGNFILKNIPVGRISLRFSCIGYETISIPDIQIMSGKEKVMNIEMQESITEMDQVVVTAVKTGEPIDEMGLISARSISPDETNRYAGGFNDPARILSNFAGVNNSQDGSADIIIRGNAPKYMQWRLEGVEITNPSHFADPMGSGTNGISALNNNILSTSDFYTGAFPAEYGDVLSGIYDVRLRNGNNQKLEGILGAGIVGTDLTLEGPFKKGYEGSFLMNYRFTTAGLIKNLGLLDDLGGIPEFQDGAFKIKMPTGKLGTFSLFGLAGSSLISFEDVNPGIWQTPNPRGRREDITEDYRKKAFLINTGINHTIPVGPNSYLMTTLAYSNEGIADIVTETLWIENEAMHTRDNFYSDINNETYRGNLTYYHKINARNLLQLGTKHAHFKQNFDVRELIDDEGNIAQRADFEESINTWRNFISWKYRHNNRLSVVLGIHNMNVIYNKKSTLEPRLAASWQVSTISKWSVGYGLHSKMESIHNYFSKVSHPDGNVTTPNKNLDLLRAHHYVVGYEHHFPPNLRAKVEVYYQDLFNLPVENSDTSSYSTINETVDTRFVYLVNEGTGYNYGLEFTLEKFFSNNIYYLFNTSLFQSKYTALDGVERNTAFNNNYLLNFLFGKEYVDWGKKKNQTFEINTKLFFGGGRRIIPLLRDSNGNLAVEPANNKYYDNTKAYENSLEDIYTITLALSYKWHKPKSTHELFLNIDNITNNKPKLSEYYDPEEEDGIGYLTPIGAFPNLMYRIYF